MRLAIVFLVGCWRGEPAEPVAPAAPPAPPPETAPCGKAAAQYVALKFDPPSDSDEASELRLVYRDGIEDFAELCRRQHWDLETRSCIATATKRWEVETCVKRLPPPQQRDLIKQEFELIAKLRDQLERFEF